MEKTETGIINVLTIGIICCTVIMSALAVFLNMYAYDLSKEERTILSEKNFNVEFIDGNTINFKNAAPGTSINKRIVVSANENATGISKYRIYLDVLSNNIASEYLIYKMEGSSNLGPDETSDYVNVDYTSFNEDGSVEYLEGELKPGEVHTYTYILYYSTSSTVKKNSFKSNLVAELVETNDTSQKDEGVPAE